MRADGSPNPGTFQRGEKLRRERTLYKRIETLVNVKTFYLF